MVGIAAFGVTDAKVVDDEAEHDVTRGVAP